MPLVLSATVVPTQAPRLGPRVEGAARAWAAPARHARAEAASQLRDNSGRRATEGLAGPSAGAPEARRVRVHTDPPVR